MTEEMKPLCDLPCSCHVSQQVWGAAEPCSCQDQIAFWQTRKLFQSSHWSECAQLGVALKLFSYGDLCVIGFRSDFIVAFTRFLKRRHLSALLEPGKLEDPSALSMNWRPRKDVEVFLWQLLNCSTTWLAKLWHLCETMVDLTDDRNATKIFNIWKRIFTWSTVVSKWEDMIQQSEAHSLLYGSPFSNDAMIQLFYQSQVLLNLNLPLPVVGESDSDTVANDHNGWQ